MKSLRITVAALAAATLGTLGSLNAAFAQTFGSTEVDSANFVLVSSPAGNLSRNPQLMIIEQQSDAQPCWSETGTNPTQIEPLLLNFDFTGICGRSLDSNGYSIRTADGDMGSRFDLTIQEQDGQLLLVGTPSNFPTNPYRRAPAFRIGQASGIAPNGFTKLTLDPGWRLTKRTTTDGRTLGHVYLTNDMPIAQILEAAGADDAIANPTTTPEVGLSFPDVRGDIYGREIDRAVEIGFIAGFEEDNTFRPRANLTREQLVSMIFEALNSQENLSLVLPSQVNSNPYSDVSSDRWSAAKIQFAKQSGIVSGYQDGTFKPDQPVTRAELMAIIRRAAEYSRRQRGLAETLPSTQEARAFSDTQGHWAAPVISSLTSYCGIATPLNETGNAFQPNASAQRNYAAAAIVRLLDCPQS